MRILILIVFVSIFQVSSYITQAQPDSGRSPFSWSIYLEPYYTYDFGQPEDHNRPNFLYSHNRAQELNINLALARGSYQGNRFRASLGLMAGSYPSINMAAEPEVLQYLYEANAGIKLAKSNLWFDAGVFSSHIGSEGAIGKEYWHLTRSMVADNSPYFETGGKVTYTSGNEKWLLMGLVLTGWQRIKPVAGNHLPSFGHQLQYQPNKRVLLNSSSFIGTDKPDSSRKMRYFHDAYLQVKQNERFEWQLVFDVGWEQKEKSSDAYNNWYGLMLGSRIHLSKIWSISPRLEYYSDKNHVIVPADNGSPFSNWGYSMNLDAAVRKNILWRLEARGFSSPEQIFSDHGAPSNSNFAITTSIAITFE